MAWDWHRGHGDSCNKGGTRDRGLEYGYDEQKDLVYRNNVEGANNGVRRLISRPPTRVTFKHNQKPLTQVSFELVFGGLRRSNGSLDPTGGGDRGLRVLAGRWRWYRTRNLYGESGSGQSYDPRGRGAGRGLTNSRETPTHRAEFPDKPNHRHLNRRRSAATKETLGGRERSVRLPG